MKSTLLLFALLLASALATRPSDRSVGLNFQGGCPQSISITESLVNPSSQVFSQVPAAAFYVNHPQGLYMESVFNPFGLTGNFNPYPPFQNVIGQNLGMCWSMTLDGNGEWYCSLQFTFYNGSNPSSGVCILPDSSCANFQNNQIGATLSVAGIFPSFIPSLGTVEFYLPVLGGTGLFSGVKGQCLVSQASDYSTFTYNCALSR